MRTFNETNILRRNRRLIFQQNARHYLEQVRFNQTESFEVIRRSARDIKTLFENRIDFAEAMKPQNHLSEAESRRFRERAGQQSPHEHPSNYLNIK